MIENPWALTARELSKEHTVNGAKAYTELVRLSRALDSNQLTLPELWKKFSSTFGIGIPYAHFRRLFLDDSFVRIPLVWDAVRSLRQSAGFRVFALSNMSQPAWRSLQRKYDVGSLFDGTTLSYKYGILKPDRRIFEIALEKAHRSSSESVFIDDSEPNVATASSLGFRVHLARSPADTAKFLANLN